jgi:predicted DNA-binding antitoxin AbrB/MazE fold protein
MSAPEWYSSMTEHVIHAVFENGTFRPLQPLEVEVREGERVCLHIEQTPGSTSLELAGQVYDGLTPPEIQAIERIALDRANFFRTRDIK